MNRPLVSVAFIVCFAALTHAPAAVTFSWTTVGAAGNAADTTGFGAVAYNYQISKYEVTNTQYAEFLNTAALSDPNGLYNTSMNSDARGGITRSGSSGSYTYSVKSGYENKPVVFVSHVDAQRFANWIHNGQGSGSTETGAYTVGSLAVHASNASVWIPTEDEWYKAAYYQPFADGGDTDSYWLYSTASNIQPDSLIPPSASPFSANYLYNDGESNGINGGYAVTQSGTFNNSINYLSDVGAYSNSPSYFGTFDQSGNVYEWTEGIIESTRVLRGGSWGVTASKLSSMDPDTGNPLLDESSGLGFRLASAVPEPSRALLLLVGACGALARRRRS